MNEQILTTESKVAQGDTESEDMQFYSFMLENFNEISTQSILQRCAFFSKEHS